MEERFTTLINILLGVDKWIDGGSGRNWKTKTFLPGTEIISVSLHLQIIISKTWRMLGVNLHHYTVPRK